MINGYLLERPPSVNNLFMNARKGRIKTPAYRHWLAANVVDLKADDGVVLPYGEPCAVSYLIRRFEDRRRRDLFNFEKAFSDLLVARGILLDDHLIQCGVVAWIDGDNLPAPWGASFSIGPYPGGKT